MIVGCQGAVGGQQVAEMVIPMKAAFQANAVSIPNADLFVILSCCMGPQELVHDRNPIHGQTFIELFPQLRSRPLLAGERIVLTVRNAGVETRLFSCSFAGHGSID